MSDEPTERTLALLLSDLAGFAKWAGGVSCLEVAAVLDQHYRRFVSEVTDRGGTVIKFLGDAGLAVFESEDVAKAVECARALAGPHPEPRMSAGVRVHVATVAYGRLGPPEHNPVDVVGPGVNALFMMRGSHGIRISRAVWNALAPEARGAFEEEGDPPTYVATSSGQ